ncbi:uncharacterized protein FPRO_13672 [Fusarium proliferatum ET1]|uniref:Uncharacterized protein n=1 Tax=Fusarium proliferatum (strain ET1) TaxID=1227346 RepID=A0A1L7VVL5_FUSPR|nr:uncharacterized protein FPRO_13672 [Fusarium proliferatum ET1]CZR43865.1 uncharacterized protein FPRO_13672 [Fusarium proliferatum ET1]
MPSILNQTKRKATNPNDADQRRVRQRQEQMRVHGDLQEAGRRNLPPLPNGDSNVVPPPLNVLRQNREFHSDLWFQSKARSSHLDQSNSPISPVSDTTMNDHDGSVATLTQNSKFPLVVDHNPTGSSTVGSRSSATPVNHKYYFGDKLAKVTYDGHHFKLEIGSHQSLKRSGADHSSTPTQHVYQIEDMKIGVESDGQKLTMTTSANQQTVLNADTVLSGSAGQSPQSTINQNGQQERNLFCHGTIFEIKGQLEFESVYCHLAIVNQQEFCDHIEKEVEIRGEPYIHLDLDKTPGVRYAQQIGNIFYLIRQYEGVELDAVLDKRIMDKNQHTIPIMLNVYGRETDGHEIRGFFERYNTTLFKPIHVPIKFGHGVPCSEDKGKEFFYCMQLCLLAVWNYESITKQNEWKYKWNQTAWQKNEWDDLEAKVKELTKGAVQFPRGIDVSKDWGSSLLKI